ncbi:hypothetical protein [Krasilnikoviella flava]|uniref:Uncharacterized protein n=1 Tax=Krasilnikoviella flava TaxID=526729 RepID=A0A1T5L5U2_9MICO|nr:hypothetical protein [Krasilnikoviella flava]SKC71417.1 hypothetical protein SAMN04324258_2982 [Krasilnikoviella flava]
MRRLFWVGVGVAVTVVVIQRGRKIVAQYAPEAVVDRAGRAAQDAGRRAETYVATFRREFTQARSAREAELTAALLAEGQPDPDDVRASGLRPADLRHGRPGHARHAAPAPDPEAEIAADEADLGYSF